MSASRFGKTLRVSIGKINGTRCINPNCRGVKLVTVEILPGAGFKNQCQKCQGWLYSLFYLPGSMNR